MVTIPQSTINSVFGLIIAGAVVNVFISVILMLIAYNNYKLRTEVRHIRNSHRRISEVR